MERRYYAEVAIPVPVNETFHYWVPPELVKSLAPGKRVIVEFHGRILTGFIISAKNSRDTSEKIKQEKLKEIINIIDDEPPLGERDLELARWIARYYLSSWGVVLASILPGEKFRKVRIFQLSESAKKFFPNIFFEYQLLQPLQAKMLEILALGPQTLPQLIHLMGTCEAETCLSHLKKAKLVEEKIHYHQRSYRPPSREVLKVAEKIDWNVLISKLRNKAPRQLQALLTLSEHGKLTPVELMKIARVPITVIRALKMKKLIISRMDETSTFLQDSEKISTEVSPFLKYSEILSRIKPALDGEKFQVFLLPGGNISNRMEVYFPVITEVIKRGKQAILLVPEIALTSQMEEIFRLHFGKAVVVMHSNLSFAKRYQVWWKLKKGEAFLVVGTRLAVFAPMKNLGLVIIDEEQDDAYKQGEDPKYHAREVAIEKAQREQALVIMGSATPSLESYYQMEKGIYQLLPFREDVSFLPKVEVVDMRNEFRVYGRKFFSTRLEKAILERISRKEKVALFINRRGFATVVLCLECGLVVRCPRCGVALVYHLSQRKLRCHYCNYQQDPPRTCPQCQGVNIHLFGGGTQKVEEEVKALIPGIRVARIDADTITSPGFQKGILQGFRKGEYDVLVGTQMIARGLDIPGFSLIGIVSADTGLNLPDFRAAEKTFQLLTQLISRARPEVSLGEVIIQTYNPEHYSIQCACAHDYNRFYSQEMKFRQQLGYPPYRHLISILIQGNSDTETSRWAMNLGKFLTPSHKGNSGIEILGPTPAPLYRRQGKFRWQILLLGKNEIVLKDFCRENIISWKHPSPIRISLDVDPIELM